MTRMHFDTDTVLRLLTILTLAGLLFSSGLQLTWGAIADSLRQSRIAWVVPANFLFVPALVLALIRLFQIPTDIAVAMLLLAAAPFAPVVPTFTRLARGDLALASGLTGLFPILSAFLTPLICQLSLKPILQTSPLQFSVLGILIVLISTITFPLAAGTALRHYAPALAAKSVKPIQIFSEAVGAIALGFATVTEFRNILSTGWRPLLAMAVASEVSFLVGYLLSGPAAAARVVVALGTANRNIALALLVAVASFPGTSVVAAVVANGLLLILFGLAHVGLWRFFVATQAK